MTLPMNSEAIELENLTTAQCLKNAHGHIGTAYAQFDGLYGRGHVARVLRETLDAVDWIRRALEHMDKAEALGKANRAAP